jgi:hypothetical protein
MLTSRLRTTILTLAAVTALSGTAAPIVAAQQYTGSNGTADSATCAQWYKWFQEALERANKAVNDEKPSEVTKSYGEALYELQKAKDAGCPWATATKAPPKPTKKIAVSVTRTGTARAA